MGRLLLSVAIFALCAMLAALAVYIGAYAGLASGTYWILALTVLLFVGSVAGGSAILFEAVVRVARRSPPPRAWFWFALFVFAVAAVLAWLLLFGVL